MTPSWQPSILASGWVRWSMAAGVGLTVALSAAYDESCTPQTTCEPSWLFSVVAPLFLASLLLQWWRPSLAYACGLAYCGASAFADPSPPGRAAALVYGALCLLLLARLRREAQQRRSELRMAAQTVSVPSWVAEAARREGPLPWSIRHLAGAALGLAVGLVAMGLLVGSWSTYQERLGRAEERTGTVVAIAPDDSLLATVEHEGPDGRPRRTEVATISEYDVGAVVPIRTDPEDLGWIELVNEPWDETYWLSLAVIGVGTATLFGAEAVRRRRAVRRLVRGQQRGLRVCAAPLGDGEVIGVAHADDPHRIVWAELVDPVGLERDAPEPTAAHPDGAADPPEDELRWSRPTLGLLYGDLREHGSCVLLLDARLLVAHDLRVTATPGSVLEDPRPGVPLPRDLESGPVTAEELAVLRAEAFGDTEPVVPAPVQPELPLRFEAAPWRRAVASVQVALSLAAPALAVWWLDADFLGVAAAVVGGAFVLVDGLTFLRPLLVLDGQGLWHPDGLRSALLPWCAIGQAAVRDQSVVLEVDPGGMVHADDPVAGTDLVTFESAPLGSRALAREAASAILALRLDSETSLDSWRGRRGPLMRSAVAVLVVHLAVGLLLVGVALSR